MKAVWMCGRINFAPSAYDLHLTLGRQGGDPGSGHAGQLNLLSEEGTKAATDRGTKIPSYTTAAHNYTLGR